MEEIARLQQDLLDGIQLIKSKMIYPLEKSSEAKCKKVQEAHLEMESFYELRIHKLDKLSLGLTANNSDETREKYEEIMKGIKR